MQALCCSCTSSHPTRHSVHPLFSDIGLSPRAVFGQRNVSGLDMGQAGPLTVLAWFAEAPHIPTLCCEKCVPSVAVVSSVVIPGKNVEQTRT